jgi:putative endonuclease
MKTWWLYLLECEGERLYAGVAIDVVARFELHRTGKGAKFTRANPPMTLLAAQPFESQGEALRAEYALKQLKRAEKLHWAQEWQATVARYRCPKDENKNGRIERKKEARK